MKSQNLFIFIPFLFFYYAKVNAQEGHKKSFPDNMYGAGASKSVFFKKGVQIAIYRDANNIRRLSEKSDTILIKDNPVITNAKMYYDNSGKKDYFSAVTIDKNQKPIGEIRADYSDDKLVSGQAWKLGGSLKLNYNLDLLAMKYVATNKEMDQTPFKPDLSLGLKKMSPNPNPKMKFVYVLSGDKHYFASEKNDIYTGGKETTGAYNGYDNYYDEEYNVEHKKLFDKNVVLRHELYREYYEDGCVYEEETYYDCHGDVEYYSEDWYDDYWGESYEFYEAYYKKGKRVAAYHYDDYYYGHEYLDPRTNEWVYEWTPDMNAPEDFQPDLSDCPDDCKYWNHDFFSGFSLIREDDGADGFFLYGFEGAYTYNLSPRLGMTGDLGIAFRSENGTDITKIIALAGAIYWAKKACYSDPFVFSLHALAGISNVRYKYSSTFGSFKNSDSYFTVAVGLATGYYLTERLGIGLRLDALPTFGKNNTSINMRASLGVILRSRQQVYLRNEVY
jgi:hypothetical protein